MNNTAFLTSTEQTFRATRAPVFDYLVWSGLDGAELSYKIQNKADDCSCHANSIVLEMVILVWLLVQTEIPQQLIGCNEVWHRHPWCPANEFE